MYHLLLARHKLPNPAPEPPFALCEDSIPALTNQLIPSITSLSLLTLVEKALALSSSSALLSARLEAV